MQNCRHNGFGNKFYLYTSTLLFVISDVKLTQYIAFLIAIVGFIDDKHQLNISKKLSLQFIIIFYLTTIENCYLNDLGEYGNFKLQLSFLAIPFTILAITVN